MGCETMKVAWPAWSPNLHDYDFQLWGYLKSKFCYKAQYHCQVEELLFELLGCCNTCVYNP